MKSNKIHPSAIIDEGAEIGIVQESVFTCLLEQKLAEAAH